MNLGFLVIVSFRFDCVLKIIPLKTTWFLCVNPSKSRSFAIGFLPSLWTFLSCHFYIFIICISWTFTPMPKLRCDFASILPIVFEHVQRSNQSMIKGKSLNMKPIHPLSLFVINFLVGIQLIHSHQICVRSSQFSKTKISSVNGLKGNKKNVKYKQRMLPKLLVLIGHVEKSEQQMERKYSQHHFQHNFIWKMNSSHFEQEGLVFFFVSSNSRASFLYSDIIDPLFSLFIYSFELRHLPMCLVLSIRFLLLMLAV